MDKIKKIARFIKHNKKFSLLLLFFAIFYVVIFIIFRTQHISQAEVQKIVEPYGVWGILVLSLVQIVFSLTPMPDGAMPIISYMLYGPLGVVVITIGMYIAGLIHYYIGHRLGKSFIIKHFPQITKFMEMLNNGNTILKLVYIRMFSIVSFDVTSYLAGITNISLKTYSIAFIIGIIPNNVTIMLISSGLFANTLQDQILIFISVILAITLLAYLYKRSRIKLD